MRKRKKRSVSTGCPTPTASFTHTGEPCDPRTIVKSLQSAINSEKEAEKEKTAFKEWEVAAESWFEYAKALIRIRDPKDLEEIKKIIEEEKIEDQKRGLSPFKSFKSAEIAAKKAIEHCRDGKEEERLKNLLDKIKRWGVTAAFSIKPLEFTEKNFFQGKKANEIFEKIKSYIDGIPTGVNIGIAGKRGLGKSSLLNMILGHYKNKKVFFTLRISVPSKIERMDFLLAIFQEACENIIEDRYEEKEKKFEKCLKFAKFAIVPIFIVLIVLTHSTVLTFSSSLTLASLILLLLVLSSSARRIYPSELLYWESRRFLDRILYKKREKTTKSIGLPNFNAIFGREVETEYREYTPTRVVSDFKKYVLELQKAYEGVVIGIDELDKLEKKEATEFLRNIKDLMMIKNCHFIVTGSDEVFNSYFDRRERGERDEFESTFDEVLILEEIGWEDAKQIVNKRLALLGKAINIGDDIYKKIWFLALKNTRDIIRISRDLLLEKIFDNRDINAKMLSEHYGKLLHPKFRDLEGCLKILIERSDFDETDQKMEIKINKNELNDCIDRLKELSMYSDEGDNLIIHSFWPISKSK